MAVASLDAVCCKEYVDYRLLCRFNNRSEECVDRWILLVEDSHRMQKGSCIMGNALCRGKGNGQVAAPVAAMCPGIRQSAQLACVHRGVVKNLIKKEAHCFCQVVLSKAVQLASHFSLFGL